MIRRPALAALALVLLAPGVAHARELATIERIDAARVTLVREDAAPVTVWLSADTVLDKGDRKLAAKVGKGPLTVDMPAGERQYLILQGKRGKTSAVAERKLPLEQGSNFRDLGGYVTKDGRTVRWGKAFRSGAMPLLSEADQKLIGGLMLDSVVDLRSQEERELTADTIDDRTGAMFISNDYSMRTLFAGFQQGQGENMYKGMEVLLVPQFRSLYRRIMADEGAVLYHCSAGQDRTGIATALLYDLLGVDRETILKDYHLSTDWRDPRWEMPAIDPKQHANNPLVQFYAALPEAERSKAQPLYTASGQSHLAQFFAHLDAAYGGSEGYMKQKLGFTDDQIARLRTVMLD
jgi:protein-tyrosine phosphatase